MKKSVNFTGLISKGSAGYKKAKVGGILCIVGIFSVKLEVIPVIGLVCVVIGIILTVIACKEHVKSVKDITDTVVIPMLEKTFPINIIYANNKFLVLLLLNCSEYCAILLYI